MKAIITADIHNGYPKHIDESIWSMQVMREYASQNGIGLVLVLGDLFHDRVNLNIEVLTKVYDFFDETDEKYDQRWVCFPGNHDMFLKNSWNVNSLRPLNRLLDIYEDVSLLKIEGTRFWILPFVHFESAYMQILSKIEAQHKEGDILLTHIGVNGSTLNACFLLQNWSVVTFENSPFDRIFTGHFHCHQQVGHNVWYPGSPIPYRFDEGLVEHGFIVFDTESRNHEFIPMFETGADLIGKEWAPSDYITTTDDDILSMGGLEGNKVKIALSREYTKNELEEIRNSLQERGAKSVTWIKHKEKEKELDIKKEQIEKAGMGSLDNLFKSWVEHDKPKMNRKLLFKLNDQISQEAKEVIIVEDADE